LHEHAVACSTIDKNAAQHQNENEIKPTSRSTTSSVSTSLSSLSSSASTSTATASAASASVTRMSGAITTTDSSPMSIQSFFVIPSSSLRKRVQQQQQQEQQPSISLLQTASSFDAKETTLKGCKEIVADSDDHDNDNDILNDDNDDNDYARYSYEPCYKQTNLFSFQNRINFQGK